MGDLIAHGRLPKNLSVLPIDREDYERVCLDLEGVVVFARPPTYGWIDWLAMGHGGGQEKTIAPNDWRRVSLAWQRYLPAYVFLLATSHGRVSLGGDAVSQGTPPLSQLVLLALLGAR